MRTPLLCLLLMSALAGAGGSAQASLLSPLDLPALVERAEYIVVGQVEGQTARWLDDQRSSIVTDVRVRVTRAMAGAREGELVTVRRLGGSVDGIGMRVVGEASFHNGEEVVLFAERRGEHLYSVGMTQGTLHVETVKGQKRVSASLAGAELIQKAGVSSTASAGPRPLDDVLRDVSALLHKAQRARKGGVK